MDRAKALMAYDLGQAAADDAMAAIRRRVAIAPTGAIGNAAALVFFALVEAKCRAGREGLSALLKGEGREGLEQLLTEKLDAERRHFSDACKSRGGGGGAMTAELFLWACCFILVLLPARFDPAIRIKERQLRNKALRKGAAT